MPRPESVKCVDVESTVSGGRDSRSTYERLAGGEADTGSGGLSMVARVTPLIVGPPCINAITCNSLKECEC